MTMQRRRGPKRKLEWTELTVNAVLTGATTQMSNLIINYLGDYGMQPSDLTVTRIIGDLFIGKTATGGVADDLNIGIISVTDQAFGAGFGSVPSPGTDREADWMYRKYVPMPGTLATDGSGAGWTRVHIDVKSQRVLRGANRSLAIVFKSQTAGENWQVFGGFATLLKSP